MARAPALHAGGHRFDSDILHFLESSLTYIIYNSEEIKKVNKGRMVDALALRDEEGRDKLR